VFVGEYCHVIDVVYMYQVCNNLITQDKNINISFSRNWRCKTGVLAEASGSVNLAELGG
jgi:hypothetical protein